MQQHATTRTRQGVRNLNGPSMDGRHNGRRTKCDHHRDPRMPTFVVPEDRWVTRNTDHGPANRRARVAVHYCISCGEERYLDGND